MELFLTSPARQDAGLTKVYKKAFREATELYLVSAYLTTWQAPQLNKVCEIFTFIIGKDFGITRKAACESVLEWLPKRFLADFLVADSIAGFHPKALFWRDGRGRFHMLVGSSNMTEAAMSGNVEANVYRAVTREEFDAARQWVGELANNSVPVSGWLDKYEEAKRWTPGGGKGVKKGLGAEDAPVMPLALPDRAAGDQSIRGRRRQIKIFDAKRQEKLLRVFRRRVANQVSDEYVYGKLGELWEPSIFQEGPWKLHAKNSDWGAFARAFVAACDASDEKRDGVVQSQLDRLANAKVPTRRAVFTELLCRYFPDAYPLLNTPVEEWVRMTGYKAPYGVSYGTKYLFLAKTLRAALAQKPKGYPARNMAELDLYIWAWTEHRRAREKARRRR
jgi:hypothetical protein